MSTRMQQKKGPEQRESDSLLRPDTLDHLESISTSSDPATTAARRLGYISITVFGFATLLIIAAVYGEATHPPLNNHSNTFRRNSDDDGRVEFCEDGDYSKKTLKLAYELPFAALFQDPRGQTKYEASSVIKVNDAFYAVCDSSWAISKFDASLQPFSSANVQIGDPNRDPNEESGYEGLFYDNGVFYAVRESVAHHHHQNKKKGKAVPTYHAIIEELTLDEEAADYDILDQCSTEFEFEGTSKGFEGAIAIHDLNNELVVLGLCEGNFCSERYKDKTGNGRVVAMRKNTSGDTCVWETIKVMNVPSSADFLDYSGMDMNDKDTVLISSQENSQMWMGKLMGKNEARLWDVDAMEFDMGHSDRVYSFPKSSDCKTIYCNVEGIHFLNDEMIIGVSDKMKSHGKQDFRCFDKDQSIHAFVLPAN